MFYGQFVSQSQKVMPKRISRMAAVQFMYQSEITGQNSAEAVHDFINAYISNEEDYSGINLNFFKRLVSDFQEEVDFNSIINESLDDGKSLSNASTVGKCIIKVAIIEMIFEKTDVPVIINEYVEIAKEFLDKNAIKFINALLDKVSKQVERKCQKEV